MVDVTRKLFDRFGRLDTWIVGIQYYDGAKELDSSKVSFKREPHNPFHANAIAVYTRSGKQIGHLPRRRTCLPAPSRSHIRCRPPWPQTDRVSSILRGTVKCRASARRAGVRMIGADD